MLRKTCGEFLLLAALCLCGCGQTMVSLSAKTGLKAVEDDWDDEARSKARPRGSIVVQLDIPSATGFKAKMYAGSRALLQVEIEESLDIDAPNLDWIETQAERIRVEKDWGIISVLSDIRPTAMKVIRKRLSQRFSDVTVTTPYDDDPLPDYTVRVASYQVVEFGPEKEARVDLEATPYGGGEPVTVTGNGKDYFSKGNLAWMLICNIIGFPLAIPATMAGSQGLHKKAWETAYVRALDEAARKLAKELAEGKQGR